MPKFTAVGFTVNCGVVVTVPLPLSATFAVPPVVELLVIVSCPDAAPADVGLNCTCSVTAWFGFNVTGKVAPDTLKPAPLTVAALIVTAAVPVDVSVTGWVTGDIHLSIAEVHRRRIHRQLRRRGHRTVAGEGRPSQCRRSSNRW